MPVPVFPPFSSPSRRARLHLERHRDCGRVTLVDDVQLGERRGNRERIMTTASGAAAVGFIADVPVVSLARRTS